MGRRILGALAAAATVAILAGCAGAPATSTGHSQLDAAVGKVPERSVAPLPQLRLAHGLAPPTNKWFSGLVFGDQPLPVFPLPLSFNLTGNGFVFGVPAVHTGADTITGGLTPDISADVGAASNKIVAYDDASVTIAELDDSGAELGRVVIAEGSPLVSFTAKKSVTVRQGQPFTKSGAHWSAKVGDSEYGLVTKGEVHGSTVSLDTGQSAVWIAVPQGGSLDKLASSAAPLTSTSVDFTSGGTNATTTVDYHAVNGADTLFATMPHQRVHPGGGANCDLGSYPSIYGSLQLCSGTSLKWSSPTLKPAGSLPVDRLNSAQKDQLKKQLADDITSSKAPPNDTYFGGKALYRLANLLQLADQLGDTSATATLQKTLSSALRKWTDPNGCKTRETECFVYDAKARGIVGLKASFGSDQFNDHHFHYGYFLYAASIAAGHDPKLAKQIAPVMNLLAADLATSGKSSKFPERRVFDAYAGHSWASGYSPFADGNNQESSSEAVSAWNGLALWAGVTKNQALEREAGWMLSSEAASASAYWTNFDQDSAVYRGYNHSIVSLNWGAKRDYSTWFSADPGAKLGILLVPMSPVAGYLDGGGGDDGRIAKNLAQGAPNGYEVALGDYLLMYSAMQGGDQAAKALGVAEKLPEKFIDDGNSRSYLLAWIMTR